MDKEKIKANKMEPTNIDYIIKILDLINNKGILNFVTYYLVEKHSVEKLKSLISKYDTNDLGISLVMRHVIDDKLCIIRLELGRDIILIEEHFGLEDETLWN